MGKGITKTGCFVCEIGILQFDGETRLVNKYDLMNFNKLKEEENERIDSNKWLREKAKERIRKKIYTMKEYADKKAETDLIRFDYCPYCGEKIDWDEISESECDNDV